MTQSMINDIDGALYPSSLAYQQGRENPATTPATQQGSVDMIVEGLASLFGGDLRALVLAFLEERFGSYTIVDLDARIAQIVSQSLIGRDEIAQIARNESDRTPVKPHVHRASSVTFSMEVRRPSLLMGLIGGIIGGLAGLFMILRHITVGAGAGFSHTGANVFTVLLMAAFVGVVGWLIGRKEIQQQTVNVDLTYGTYHPELPTIPNLPTA